MNYKNAYEEMKRLYDKLQQENKKYKEVIDKAIEFTNKKWGTWCTHHLEYMTELQNILKEVSEWIKKKIFQQKINKKWVSL